MPTPLVSILMLTHNAPEYVAISVNSVFEKTEGVSYELVVVDNASEMPTKTLVQDFYAEGKIQRLEMSERNTLFAEGNNIAAALASKESPFFLLLNSDIEVKRPDWLVHLLEVHQRGITAYGTAADPDRVDGSCLLIDADLYRQYRLNEGHQWWWSVTKLQAELLTNGFSVQGFSEHEEYLHHFGGKSGSAFKNAKGMNVTREEVRGWFNGLSPVFLDRASPEPAQDEGRSGSSSLFGRMMRKLRH